MLETRTVCGRTDVHKLSHQEVLETLGMVEPTVCRCTQIESSASLETCMVYGRTYCLQMYTNRVISKFGNLHGVW